MCNFRRGREAGLCIIIINTLGQSHISPSHTILAGQNPAYGTRAEAIQVSVPTAPDARAAVNGKAEHSASMSLQERDFSNPMYCKDIETEDHYTPLPNSEDFYAAIGQTDEDIYAIPGSPSFNIYERVPECIREDAPTPGSDDGDLTYSIIS